jgi:hypothetical protein
VTNALLHRCIVHILHLLDRLLLHQLLFLFASQRIKTTSNRKSTTLNKTTTATCNTQCISFVTFFLFFELRITILWCKQHSKSSNMRINDAQSATNLLLLQIQTVSHLSEERITVNRRANYSQQKSELQSTEERITVKLFVVLLLVAVARCAAPVLCPATMAQTVHFKRNGIIDHHNNALFRPISSLFPCIA